MLPLIYIYYKMYVNVSLFLLHYFCNNWCYFFQKSDVIPSIPKPKSSISPKLGRNTPPTAEAKPSNGAADLLGLDTAKPNDDIFSSFFSAPQEKPVEPPKEDLKTEEENFFKQAAPTEKEKSKLTKDSILALYSQTPSNNLANFQNSTQASYQNPVQNTFQNPPQTGNFQNPAQTASFQNPAQSGSYQFGAFQQQSGYNSLGNVNVGNTQQNGMFNQYQMGSQFQQPFGAPLQQPAQNQQFASNQFFNQPQGQTLPQQFASLNLAQSFPAFAQPNTNVASNSTWQWNALITLVLLILFT